MANKIGFARRLKNAILGYFDTLGDGTYTPRSAFSSQAGQQVDVNSAMQLAAVWSCVRLISETIGSLPAGMYRRGPGRNGGSKQYAPDHPLHLVIHAQPSSKSTACIFWEAFVASMLLTGNAFAEKLMIGPRVVGLRFLSPPRLMITKLSDGTRQYFYTYDDGVLRQIPTERVWRVAGFTLDGDWGLSAIRYGAQIFGAGQAANESAAKTFKQGLMPTTYYSYPDKTLTAIQRQAARQDILAKSGAQNAGQPIILENGMTAGTLGISPSDAQLLESRRFSREEICSFFRVPPWLVGYGEKSTAWGTGMEQQMQAYIQMVLQPYLIRIEQGIAKDLLSPVDRATYYARFSFDGLLRGDSAARANFYDKMIKGAVYTPDECRELEDLPPMGGNAGKLIVNSATTLLDSLGKSNVTPQQTDSTQQPGGSADDGVAGDPAHGSESDGQPGDQGGVRSDNPGSVGQ